MFQEAVDVCRSGLSVHPTYLSARVTLGRALIDLQQFELAQIELEQVLRAAPENLAAIRGLADVLHRLGAFHEALTQYRAALTLVRHDPDLEQTIEELERRVQSDAKTEPVLAQAESAPESLPLSSPDTIQLSTAPAGEQEHMRAVATLAALEQLLTAVHVARAQRCA
jgi:tetratricopeptide (TPR) repeat protein